MCKPDSAQHANLLPVTMPGSYQYDCAVHGQLMTGTIVVVDTASLQPPPDTMPVSGR